MSKTAYLLLGLIVAGLAAHLTGEPVAPTALEPIRQPVEVPALQPIPRAWRATAEACLAAGDCAYHVTGYASRNPLLQLSIVREAAATWSDEDWQGALELTRMHARWVRGHAAEALAEYGPLSPEAPFFSRAAELLPQNLRTVSVGIAERTPKDYVRPNIPGFDAENAPGFHRVPVDD